MNAQTVKEIKNKRGELKMKVVQGTNRNVKKGIDFDTINDLYQELLEKYKPEDLTIIAKPLDGNFITLKSAGYAGDTLKYADESYYSSLPKQIKDSLQGKYYSIQITVKL
ncbi:MAG: hypothetical protein EOO43_01225 [Flavobacterium sp.]|nr:MAG: hypothetical protein EOO43_01225 [Flavobacterium sp.]